MSALCGGSKQRKYLKTAFAEELIGRAERYLNDGGEFGHLFRSVVLNVGNTLEQPRSWMRTGIKSTEKYLEISRELFYDGLPRDKAVDEDIGGTKVMWGDILLDERL
jgi:hypothetical protein